MVGPGGGLEHVDRQLDVHVAAHALAPVPVHELPGRLFHHVEAIIGQPVDQRPDRAVVVIFDERGVVAGADKAAACLELLEKLAEIDLQADSAGSGVKVGPVDEQGEALILVEGHWQCPFLPIGGANRLPKI